MYLYGELPGGGEISKKGRENKILRGKEDGSTLCIYI
jgi:hypothetical protein